MSRYRLLPSPAQEAVLREHCGHARFVWNLAVEQHQLWRPGRKNAPGYLEQCRQLTAARREHAWLRVGSQMVQQQALRDFARAMANFFGGTHCRPSWRKTGRDEGFRIVAVKPAHVRRLSRNTGVVWVPKAGWVRFRWSRAVPDCKSYRVTLDRAGRWHVAFAAIQQPIPGPRNGETVGVDRGVAVSAALSTGELLTVPRLSPQRQRRLVLLQRRLARARRGSCRRVRIKAAIGRLRAREADARKDWCEKVSTDLARRFDVIRVEDLRIASMTRSAKGTTEAPGRNIRAKAGLNREIAASGWGLLARRLEDKAPSRIEKINPAHTSQRCSACGHIAAESRKSQAHFACVACNYACNADVNAARNIAAGHAVTARGRLLLGGRLNREPRAA
jgi:transposase